MKKVYEIFNYKPVTVIGIISAIHTLMYGVGYLFNLSDFANTVLYQNVTELMDPHLFGCILIIVGLASIFAFLYGKIGWVSATSTAQAFVWLFAAFVYFFSSSIALGIAVGLVWSFLNAYSGYVYKQKDRWANVEETFERGPDGKLIL